MSNLWKVRNRIVRVVVAIAAIVAMPLWTSTGQSAQPSSAPATTKPAGEPQSAEVVQQRAAWELKRNPQLTQEVQTRPWPKAVVSVPLKNQLQLDFRIPEDWTVVEGEDLWPPKKTDQGWMLRTPGGASLKLTLVTRDSDRAPVLNEWTLFVLSKKVQGIDQDEVAAWKKLSDLEFAQVIIDSRKWLREGSPEYQQRKAVLFCWLFGSGNPWTVRYEDDARVALVLQIAHRDAGQAEYRPPAAIVTVYDRQTGQYLYMIGLFPTAEPELSDADFLSLVEQCLGALR